MLSIKEILKKAWEKFLLKPGLLMGTTFVLLLLSSLDNIFIQFMPDVFDNILWNSLMSLAGFLISILISMALLKIALDVFDGRLIRLEEIFNSNLILSFVATHIIYVFIVTIGFLLLIIPGWIWAIKFSFCLILVIDRGLNPMDALKTSSELTYGYKWQIFRFLLIISLINLAGALVLGLGLLVSIPVSFLAFIDLYRILSQRNLLV